jgi:preprotein translocase subunit SecA
MSQLERVAALRAVDDEWREHLRVMDDLKEGIYLRAYGQKDPILEYKQEAYRVFLELLTQINEATVSFAFKYFPQFAERAERQAPTRPAATVVPSVTTSTPTRQLRFSHPSATSTSTLGGDPNAESSQSASTIRNAGRKVGRNEPCPCGSGMKFKACHGASGATTYPA